MKDRGQEMLHPINLSSMTTSSVLTPDYVILADAFQISPQRRSAGCEYVLYALRVGLHHGLRPFSRSPDELPLMNSTKPTPTPSPPLPQNTHAQHPNLS